MLDAFDAMLYALVLTHVMRDLGMSKATSGLLYMLTLLASGMGRVAIVRSSISFFGTQTPVGASKGLVTRQPAQTTKLFPLKHCLADDADSSRAGVPAPHPRQGSSVTCPSQSPG